MRIVKSGEAMQALVPAAERLSLEGTGFLFFSGLNPMTAAA